MAKKPKKTAGPAAAATVADLPACRLTAVPLSTDFQGVTGATVNLVTKSHVGTVLISKLEYGGTQLVPAGQAVASLALTVLRDRNTLKAVFMFDASTSGRGELREDCGNGDSHFLRALAGDEPLQVLRIIGT